MSSKTFPTMTTVQREGFRDFDQCVIGLTLKTGLSASTPSDATP